MKLHIVGKTDKGVCRDINQDAITFNEKIGYGFVADGIGGHSGGEVASAICVDQISRFINEKYEYLNSENIEAQLAQAIQESNNEIFYEGENNAELKGMGTTLNGLLACENKIYIAHIGDSRTYLYFEENFWPLTIDHNIATFLKRGWINPENLKAIENTNTGALVKAMGLARKCDHDLYVIEPREGFLFLTASDGLFDMVSDKEIFELIRVNTSNLKQLLDKLIEKANENGGRDNISIILSRVEDL